jgi:3-hydroxyacyl-CoA dehydrogenase
MVEQGAASVADTDNAMVHGYRHPVARVRLTDRIGERTTGHRTAPAAGPGRPTVPALPTT